MDIEIPRELPDGSGVCCDEIHPCPLHDKEFQERYKNQEQVFSHGPAEIYEPVQTLKLRMNSVEVESGTIYHTDEIYCNVPIASRRVKADDATYYHNWFECVGRLTISSGVAYVDVG